MQPVNLMGWIVEDICRKTGVFSGYVALFLLAHPFRFNYHTCRWESRDDEGNLVYSIGATFAYALGGWQQPQEGRMT